MVLGEAQWWQRELLLGKVLEGGEEGGDVDVGCPWWGREVLKLGET